MQSSHVALYTHIMVVEPHDLRQSSIYSPVLGVTTNKENLRTMIDYQNTDCIAIDTKISLITSGTISRKVHL